MSRVMELGEVESPAAVKALEKLSTLGGSAVPPVLEALAHADKKQTVAYVDILSQTLTDKTFALYGEGLKEKNERVVAGIAWAMTSSNTYNPSLLLELLRDPDTDKAAVISVLKHNIKRLNIYELLRVAYKVEPHEKAAIFGLIASIATEDMVPDLIERMEGKDSIAKVHIINILFRYNKPEVRRCLEIQLADKNKMVRQAALSALANMEGDINAEPVMRLLRDPDLEVQNKAVDLVIKINHPDTIKYLVHILKDESEYIRRAAVEVLNEVGDADSIKHLLEVISDEDWWVRSRAADALAKIGGPKVVDAVMELIGDEDEGIRRAAIEILNVTRDERAIDKLISATKDKDWWVSERAVDALAEIGSKKATPALLELVKSNHKAMPVIIRALSKIGDEKCIDVLMPLLDRPEKAIRLETMVTLTNLADASHLDAIRKAIVAQAGDKDDAVNRAATRAVKKLDRRFSDTAILSDEEVAQYAEPEHTMLMDKADVAEVIREAEKAQILDITTLKAGDIIAERYKFITQIGKGAFGTVLLVEDSVVEEQLILKFLNPNVSSDEEMLKRFVHELRYSRKITHKNVIRIYDFLHLQGLYAISMEYFPSHTLGGEVVDEKPVSVKKGVRFACDIATGMAVAHAAGIIHRDLKPANILINEDGLLKIVDFGVAAAQKSGDTQLTKTGYVIGSPKYMAPEQILGKKVDVQADVYSLGIILYELLTGVPPYRRGDHMSVMYQHVQGKAPSAIEVNDKIPQELSDIIGKAMSLDPKDRHETMDDIYQAMDAYL
ncbi:MAG: HEAT repeat domain-containing protein [Proteobacteria bacterium]|nr:HEAT repeat domain-containing protein [Pseudomonadota bacterium]